MRTLAITLGDPCGLGPELVVRALRGEKTSIGMGDRLLLLGPEAALLRELRRVSQDSPPFWTRLDAPEKIAGCGPGIYLFEPAGLAGLELPPGKACPAGGLAAGKSLALAVALAKSGVVAGLVTCPLNKAMLQSAGFDFPGHTEFLAEGFGLGRSDVTMHLCGPMPKYEDELVLRVSLVTTHPPLSEVPRLVTRAAVLRAIRHTSAFAKRLGLTGAIGVCGLNPHAGESGRIGCEEGDVVCPAVEQAREEGIAVAGPIPADTLFHFAARGGYPAVVAMYHDQGLAPLKLLHFGEAVNITLGLPIVRTSPDHGTGYDLVGTGKAKLTSFVAALDMARRLVG